ALLVHKLRAPSVRSPQRLQPPSHPQQRPSTIAACAAQPAPLFFPTNERCIARRSWQVRRQPAVACSTFDFLLLPRPSSAAMRHCSDPRHVSSPHQLLPRNVHLRGACSAASPFTLMTCSSPGTTRR